MHRYIWLMLLCACPVSVLAADLSGLYSDHTLQYWQGKYAPHMQWNFKKLVLGSLTPDERRTVGRVRLEMPLRAPGSQAGDPVVYYADGHRIVMPVQSIKFFDDLAQAWAYAWSNKLNMEYVTNYISMLKYHAAPAGGFPAPLQALGIPEDAWKTDKAMDDVSQRILKSAMVFIMAHELAHIMYAHPGYAAVPASVAQANELQADQFATEIMRRIAVAPGGMVNMFMLFAHYSPTRGDFESEAAWKEFRQSRATHPVSATRLRAMARDLTRSPRDFSAAESDSQAGQRRVLYIASQINHIADILADSHMQRFISAKARNLDLASIRYSKHGKAAMHPRSGGLLSGDYRGVFRRLISAGGQEEVAISLQLKRQGKRVHGSFDFGFGAGKLEGVVIDGVLHFQWSLGNTYGQGVLRKGSAAGQLSGHIGYAASDRTAGSWHLQRR